MIWVSTNGRPSNSAKALSALPGFRRLREARKPLKKDVIVNWGSSTGLTSPAIPAEARVLNSLGAVKRAANKLLTFIAMAGEHVECVPWTANADLADEWLGEGYTVVARTILTGHSGEGIILLDSNAEFVDAPLYTKYVPKVAEYRVHVVNGAVIDTQRKVRNPEVEPLSWKIRSHKNGFIFQRGNIAADAERDSLAIQAVESLGLDFGAVDIITDKTGRSYVLEINTAPGLEGQTVTSYANAFQGYVNE